MVRQHSEPDVGGSHDAAPLFTTTTTLGVAEDSHHGFISSNVYEYFNAVEAGQTPVIPIANTAFISSMRNATGETLLIAAARCGNLSAAEALIKEVDVEETDNDGWSALLNAAHQGHAAIVELLLDSGAAIDQHDLMGWTSLMWACYKNHLQAVDILLKRKAHINIAGEEDSLTPLIIASGRGYTDIVHRLLESSAQVNSTDKFGSTALIWAARRGYYEIVTALLNAGAELDVIGMYASTALMLATRGNHIKVVDAIISRDPNVNIVDYNGLSALGIAAREGYTQIAQTLVQSGAYVNTVDRFGNSILASAVRSGNIQLVRMLLEKHADVNAKDSDNRTPLHLAIDKGYGEIALALLEKRPNLEIRNKDGETALLRAVKNRDVALCQLLISVGAKLSATDNSGDNALHLALRARSRRITQVLLVNPSDSKLLYRPNKLGETPYSIDQEASDQPILPTIFGPIGSADLELKNLFGYESYGDVLADVVCEPNLSLPLTIGLYAKWGSGKSLLLPKIRQSMKSFSRSWLEGMELYWSWTLVFILFVFCAFAGLCFASLLALASLWSGQMDGITTTDSPSSSFDSISWIPPLVFTISIYVVILSSYGFVYYGSEVRLWNGSITTARFLARSIAHFKVLLSVLTLRAPMRTKELVVSPVSFLFADDHRLSFVGAGEQALANIVQSLFLSAEEHYGTLAVRLFTAFNFSSGHVQVPFGQQQQSHGSKLQTFCGIPTILYMVVMFASVTISMCFLLKHVQLDELNRLTSSYAIFSTAFFVIFIITALVSIYLLFVRLTLNLPKRRIARIAHNTHLLPFERVVQKLQRVVDQLVALVNALDAFTNCQTRMVIMVDGLDSCEQNKMVQMLDALTLFFGSRQNVPFVVVLAVDPHIVISAIQQNLLRGVLGGGLPSAGQKPLMATVGGGNLMNGGVSGGGGASNEITGYDYMRNIVTMPFFLDCSGGGLQNRLRTRGSTKRRFHDAILHKRSETIGGGTFLGSRMSLREADRSKSGDGASTLGQAIANSSLFLSSGGTNAEMSNLFPSFDYFSNMNPRTMHRIVNSIALTGRLMRTFDVEFSWFMLYLWISLVEQWPYRMCWLIECCCTEEEDDDCFALDPAMPLKELYVRIKDDICINCQLATDLDRNVGEFEALLLHKSWKRYGRSANNNASDNDNAALVGNSAKQQQNYEQQQYASSHQPTGAEQITVCYVQIFANCTSNLDPYMRKQVRELRASVLESKKDLIELRKEADTDRPLTADVWRDVCLFGDESQAIWNVVAAKPLVRMTIDEVVALIAKMNISSVDSLTAIVEKFRKNNLNGLVLQTCDLTELKDLLQASLGDWTLVKLLIETLRKIKSIPGRRILNAATTNPAKYSITNRETAVVPAVDDRGSVPPPAKSLLSIKEERGRDKNRSPTCPVSINLPDANDEKTGVLQNSPNPRDDEDGNASSQSMSDSDSLKSVVGSQQNLVAP